jgi:hypothetical protein
MFPGRAPELARSPALLHALERSREPAVEYLPTRYEPSPPEQSIMARAIRDGACYVGLGTANSPGATGPDRLSSHVPLAGAQTGARRLKDLQIGSFVTVSKTVIRR